MPRKNRKNRQAGPKGATRRPASEPQAQPPEPSVLREGVKVSAVNAHRGAPATTIHVEVDRDRVRATVGDGELEEVLARVPAQDAGSEALRWHDERLEREPSGPGGAARYTKTHYGATEAARYGVGVVIKTKKGSVEARPSGDVRETDKPEGTHPDPSHHVP